MYLLVRLTSPPGNNGQLYSLEFADEARALHGLSALRNGRGDTVTIENERGELISVLRSAIEKAWIANEVPAEREVVPPGDDGSALGDPSDLVNRLGPPPMKDLLNSFPP